MQVNFILLLIVSIFIAIFAIQNGDTVTIDLFFFQGEMSQALVILASVGLGALVTVALSTFGKIKRLRNIKALNKQIKGLTEENTTLSTKNENLEKENTDLQQLNSDLKSELSSSEEKIKELSKRPGPQTEVHKEENSAPVEEEEQTD
ncbi:Uncharacterized integral membrane protein [Dethiosulfatibacter aminovorans DSM 17477]|uniref:Uncharacterized integral membrane protein n=1 Tax=Dethiosulfatibacter aminovorans DSM 17477 TaxID=1121476 RepID=A0A1M6D3X0_9FIRM|nr:LapA family protein [Dethiosulfatibacter aminovorans]SHI67947.1 Uncharacterized integral membrane protein [Dethiosulfatibacter aminovorans DSM 17477]